jgi:uncharacterized lipoprotein YddW (UPF0748 family)
LKAIIRFLFLFLLTLHASAQTSKHEIRAVWLTTIGGIDWPHSYATTPQTVRQQKQELTRILDQLRQANINTVLLQTRVRATTIFPSSMEPWDGCLSGKPGTSPGYDALQFAIDECHKRGMQCHAWIVTIPVGKWNTLGCKTLRQKYPKQIIKIGEEGYMNPEMPQTANYLARFCEEVTQRYDIDGIHLDYIRYPETWKLKVSRSQGRSNITNIVRKIYNSVKALKPWVMVSCSPIGKYDDLPRYKSSGWNANTTVCQDAQGWLRDGIMDALFPMMYFQGNNFYPFAVNWKEFSYGRFVVPGLAIYMLHPKERNWGLDILQREMYVIRNQGMGHAFFRSKFLTDNTKGIYSFTKGFNMHPALIPAMTWMGKRPPSSPQSLNIQRGMAADRLTWSTIHNNADGEYLLYNVYASEQYPVNINDAALLVATRQKDTSVIVPHGGRTLHYAVTAIDRYGNESTPSFTLQIPSRKQRKIDFRSLIMGKKRK